MLCIRADVNVIIFRSLAYNEIINAKRAGEDYIKKFNAQYPSDRITHQIAEKHYKFEIRYELPNTGRAATVDDETSRKWDTEQNSLAMGYGINICLPSVLFTDNLTIIQMNV